MSRLARRLWSRSQPHHLRIVHPYCSWGGWSTLMSSLCTSDQGKGTNKLKFWLQKEMFPRYLKLAGKGPEFVLTRSRQELAIRRQIHVMEGAAQSSVRWSSADCTGDDRAVQGTARSRAWVKEGSTLEKAVWENVMTIAALVLCLWEETRRLPQKINIT